MVQRFSILAVLLCVYPLALWQFLRKRFQPEFQNGMQLLILALPGLVLLLEVLIKPNWNRIYMVSLPATFCWSVGSPGKDGWDAVSKC